MLNKLGQYLVQAYSNLRARFAARMVRKEIAKVLKLTHAQELMNYNLNEWPMVKQQQQKEIQALASGQLTQDIVDRRSWAYPYLPEALHRLNQPILKNTPYNLRRFSETPIPRRAINLIKNAILSFDWLIAPKNDEDDPNPETELAIKTITDTLERPNNTDTFRTLMEAVIEDIIVGGYGCIEPRLTPNYLRPFKLWAVDGSTIRLFLDWTESTPDRPKYAQMTGLKGERGIVTFLDSELLYIRDNVRTATPFGLGKLEVAFNTVNAFLSAQSMAANAGADQVHKTWLWWEQTINPGHMQTIRRHILNELEGQQKISLMAGLKKPEVVDVTPVKPEDLLLDWQEFLIRIIANAFDISPMSLGLERDVNRNTGQVMADADFRNAVVPMARRIEEALNTFVWNYVGRKDLEFGFIGLDDPDSLTKVMIQQRKYMMNALTPDEIREEDDRQPLPGGWGRLTNGQLLIITAEAQGLTGGKSAAVAGSRVGMGGGGGTGGMGSGGGSGAGGGGSMSFSAGQVAQMNPDEIQMYQDLGLLPPDNQDLANQMEQQQPGILTQLTDELKTFFQYEDATDDGNEVQPAEVTPEMEQEQIKRFELGQHAESQAEKMINRRGVFGPNVDNSYRKNPQRGKYPRSGATYTPTSQDQDPDKVGKDIAKQSRRHMRPGKGNPYSQ